MLKGLLVINQTTNLSETKLSETGLVTVSLIPHTSYNTEFGES